MEWIYVVVAVYLIGAVIVSWQCEQSVAEDLEHRTFLIIWSSMMWPIGLVVYFMSPRLKKFHEKLKQEEAAQKEAEAQKEKLKQRADEGYRSAVSDMVGRLRAQRDQLVKNLEECGDDEAGRAVLQESIDKTNAMLVKYDQPREVA